jgi:hypothetical protein
MPERHIHAFAGVFPDPADERATLAPIKDGMPPRAVRRMSRLGILLHHVLRGMPVGVETTLIYATTHTETHALESYLASLPYASPTAFQTSIHPGGVEQALILQQQPVGVFLPLAGESDLPLQALRCALTDTAADVIVCGGEEQGSWLQDFNLAYPYSFACALHLSTRAAGSLGTVAWDPAAAADGLPRPSLRTFARQLHDRQNLSLGGPSLGRCTITWS